jgi:predicted membrane metal-binding protein
LHYLSRKMISLLLFSFFGGGLDFLTGTWLTAGPALCRGWLPSTPMNPLYDALVCGASLPPGHEKQMFVDTGLIHLMVVSGSHLVFIELLLAFLPAYARRVVLGGYCWLTGFQAPVARAFLRRSIGPFLQRVSGLTSLQLEAATILLALSLYPPWLGSRSFLMSWMCGLALCSPKIFKRAPHFDQAVKSYLFLLPFCWASPVSVAWNTLLAPFVGLLLFPVCILAMVIPPFVTVSDWMWKAFLGILELGPQGVQLHLFFPAWSLCWVPILTHASLLILEVKWRRASAFSYLSI